MDFELFKQKVNSAGCKIGLMAKGSFAELSKMIHDDETILFACETLPAKLSGLYGAVAITGDNFYGYIWQADKTFQNINIARSEITGIEASGGLSCIAKVKTSNAEYDIGKVFDKWPKLSQIIKGGVTQLESKGAIEKKETSEKKLRCPKCGSENIEPVTITSGKTKGFGLGKAIVGGVALANPVGLAAGVIGMGKGKTKTEVEWICKSCAKQFKNPKKD